MLPFFYYHGKYGKQFPTRITSYPPPSIIEKKLLVLETADDLAVMCFVNSLSYASVMTGVLLIRNPHH